MAVVRSLGALATLDDSWWPILSYGSMRMYDDHYRTYAQLYREQPNVRTCVDFLARNIAQLGLHVFRRVSDTDRERLNDHPLAQLIAMPLPPEWKVTRYRLIESLVSDLAIYFNAFWMKIRTSRMYILRVPPVLVTVKGNLVPRAYEINLASQVLKLAPSEIVHFRGYNPENGIQGLSPLETLRRILAEEHAMGEYRENFWRNSARMHGIIERPLDAPDWNSLARERFKAEFEALYSGAENSGRTAILEEGMTWKEITFNAQESEYLGARKLTREECARAYHIPLPMVGILDHATYSNIEAQHKHLYQDCLGPWLAMIEEEIALQLLPEFEDHENVYVEFNIAEKLQGSFEEQVQALQAAVGRPWMTANEARARLNLPSLGGDADALVTPLNVLVGGQASPRDSVPKAVLATKASRELDSTLWETRLRHEEKWREVLQHYFRRQEKTILSRVPAKAVPSIDSVWFDGERWDKELAEDLYQLNVATATVWARHVAQQLAAEIIEELLYDWLSHTSRIAATEINRVTRDHVEAALGEDDYRGAVRGVFESALATRAAQIATSAVTRASNFGANEAAKQLGLHTKTWIVNSRNPRALHAAMDGETVAIGERFSNGMLWPGDPAGGAENNANCQCSVAFGRY